jgi:hypothetical protein
MKNAHVSFRVSSFVAFVALDQFMIVDRDLFNNYIEELPAGVFQNLLSLRSL